MTNAVIAIGCDQYDHLPTLQGAGHDATRMFELLCRSGTYEQAHSSLLLSPSLLEVRNALDALASQAGLDVVTIYFAGHGGSKAGTYYLCLRDSRQARLSTTALPIMHLFTIAGEMRPKQVNFVLDACHSAAAMFDLHAVLKPDVIGPARTSSFACLAASASDQYASEDADGGIATSALVRYLDGTSRVHSDRPYLDLVEVGSAVAREVRSTNPAQQPVAWGLNLFGDGIFAANPHYAGSSAVPHSTLGIVPTSEIGRRLQGLSDRLWEEYRLITSDSAPDRLYHTLADVRLALGVDYSYFLRGFSPALAARGSESADLFAGSEAIGTCLVSMLPNTAAADLAVLSGLLEDREAADVAALNEILRQLAQNPYALLGKGNAYADYHFLPIRVARILSWVALLRYGYVCRGAVREDVVSGTEDLIRGIFNTYRNSLIALADDQAPWVYIFATLAPALGWQHYAQELLDRMFHSALARRGEVLRHGADGKMACQFTLARADLTQGVDWRSLANPSDLLAVILLGGAKMGLGDCWDVELARLDGRMLNLYVPDNYLLFGEPRVPSGRNFLCRVGHDFWTLGELAAYFDGSVRPHVSTARAALQFEQEIVCALAGHIFPDRVPYLLDVTGTSAFTRNAI